MCSIHKSSSKMIWTGLYEMPISFSICSTITHCSVKITTLPTEARVCCSLGKVCTICGTSWKGCDILVCWTLPQNKSVSTALITISHSGQYITVLCKL